MGTDFTVVEGARPAALAAHLGSVARQTCRARRRAVSVHYGVTGWNRSSNVRPAIRGLDAFDQVCAGIRAATLAGASLSVRVTVQRANYYVLPAFVTLARELGATQISFLAADVRNSHAFGRTSGFNADMALHASDLQRFEETLNILEQDHAQEFRSGFIAENPAKLRRLLTVLPCCVRSG